MLAPELVADFVLLVHIGSGVAPTSRESGDAGAALLPAWYGAGRARAQNSGNGGWPRSELGQKHVAAYCGLVACLAFVSAWQLPGVFHNFPRYVRTRIGTRPGAN